MPSFEIPFRIGVLASHNGSAMRAIYRAIEANILPAEIVLVISNNSKAGALTFARANNIPAKHISKKTEGSEAGLDVEIALQMIEACADIILLSGWMQQVGDKTLKAFLDQIINIHPALRDSGYEGAGLYGDRVHAAILADKKEKSGVTIHFASEKYDVGKVLLMEEVPVTADDTVDSLRERIKNKEQELIIKLLLQIVSGEIVLGEE